MNTLDQQEVINLCLSHGFVSAGISTAKPTTYASEFQTWLDDGKQGEMEWLNKNVDVRLNPSELVPDAKSIICVADRYCHFETDEKTPRGGLVARYARGSDYHRVMKKRLHVICDTLSESCDEKFRACVDTAPLLEREHAARAGLGAIGKHTLLIEQGIGSWLLLGAIVTTAEIELHETTPIDPCSNCTKCIDACPTDAISPWSVDATKCISYLTIEHRSLIDPQFFEGIGEWLFGCDICQEVCPHNHLTTLTERKPVNNAYQERIQPLDIFEVLQWNEDDRRRVLQGSAMKRANLDMIRRNALIVAGNLISQMEDSELLDRVKTIATDENEEEIVRETAIAVLEHRAVGFQRNF